VDISHLKARKFSRNDFKDFDFIYVMDHENLRDVLALAKTQEEMEKVKLLLDKGEKNSAGAVPDPWYGGDEGFVEVYNMLDQACEDIVKKLVEKNDT
jgi:protein-tyrosine phosphatase